MRRIHGRYFALLFVAITGTAALAQPGPLWITQFGTPARDEAFSSAPDGAGGVFVAGLTGGDLGGPNAGNHDAYLARYDSAGHKTWIEQFGVFEDDWAGALASDGAGGVYVAGHTGGDLGGPNAGGGDAFLARYDSEGNQAWIKQFGSAAYDEAAALASDGAGGFFVAGYTLGNLGGPNGGKSDAFLARYDSAGNQAWIKQFGTADYDSASALASDGAGGVFIAGNSGGDLGGPNAGDLDVIVARYDSAGKQIWVKQFGSAHHEETKAAASDGAGVFVAGWTAGSLGGPNAGGGDAFLARYDSAGNPTWIKQFGTADYDWAYALVSDGSGGTLVAGRTSGDLGGPNAGSSDAFLALYESAGNQTWIEQFGSVKIDYAHALAFDGAGGVFVAGGTFGSLGGPNAGERDAFLARFRLCYPDIDGSGTLDLDDFLAFINLFNASDPAADCDGSGTFDLFDFLCFVNTFNEGC